MGVARVLVKAEQDSTPLLVRASLPRTFLGLRTFAEAGLLFCGIYLLADAMASPWEANQAAVLFAAAILALAIVLLFYLLRAVAPDGSGGAA